jgi:hypothetical protein
MSFWWVGRDSEGVAMVTVSNDCGATPNKHRWSWGQWGVGFRFCRR